MIQTIICIDCGRAWDALPSDFIYDDPPSGWHQSPEAAVVRGYCAPCAQAVEARQTRYGTHDHEQELIEWERDTREVFDDEPSGGYYAERAREAALEY